MGRLVVWGPFRGTPKVAILSFSGIQSESKPPISHEIPPEEQIISTLRETDSLPLKTDGWKMTPPFYSFLFSWAKCYFQGGSTSTIFDCGSLGPTMPPELHGTSGMPTSHHQTFQVPSKWRVHPHLYISCMDTAYGYGKTHPQNSLTRFSTSILGT